MQLRTLTVINSQHRPHQCSNLSSRLDQNLGLVTIIALERANTSWERFYRSVQRAFPKLNSILELSLTDKEGEPL